MGALFTLLLTLSSPVWAAEPCTLIVNLAQQVIHDRGYRNLEGFMTLNETRTPEEQQRELAFKKFQLREGVIRLIVLRQRKNKRDLRPSLVAESRRAENFLNETLRDYKDDFKKYADSYVAFLLTNKRMYL